ncbi:MAG: ARMT1-like domain-containing protein [Promethearchaeota archaeon]
MILSKGQGNFESLYGMDIPQKDVFYLLKAKCNLMERIFDVKIGDLIFKKKENGF